MTEWIPIAGLNCAAAYLVIHFAKAILSLRYFNKHQETQEAAASVTVLQPILGGDPFLETALKNNLNSAPDNAHFLWLMDIDDQPGNQAAERVATEFPNRVSILRCSPCPREMNPKAWKLHSVLDSIESDFVAVLDDDTTLNAHHLNRAISKLNKCDIYTGLPHYTAGNSFWSSLVAHFVNNNSIVTYLSLLNWIRPITINGMFYVMRTSTLLGYGGFKPILHELCDDYAMAKLVRKHQGRIYQGVTSQTVQTSVNGGRRYFQIMHRWFVFANVLVNDQSFAMKCLLLMILGLPPLLFIGSFALLAGGWWGLLALIVILAIRHLVIISLHRKFFPERIPHSFGMSIISEFLQIPHYIHSRISPVIQWRRHRIRVSPNGSFEKQAEAAK